MAMHGDASPDIEACIYQSGAVMNCLSSRFDFYLGNRMEKKNWFRDGDRTGCKVVLRGA
jgi:hypothetical protein